MAGYKFIKKPQEIEAIPWIGSNAKELREFCANEDLETVFVWTPLRLLNDSYGVRIFTANGEEDLPLGSWLVKEDGHYVIYGAMEFDEKHDAKDG